MGWENSTLHITMLKLGFGVNYLADEVVPVILNQFNHTKKYSHCNQML